MGNNKSSVSTDYEKQVNNNGSGGEGTELVNKKDQVRKHDPNFNGPIAKRSCTDVVCCIIFCAYMFGMIIVGVIARGLMFISLLLLFSESFKCIWNERFGVTQGQPKRLLYPTDSNGKVCGVDILDKPYLYFFDLSKCITKGASDPLTYVKRGFSCPTPQVCVKKCPSRNAHGMSMPTDELVCKEGTKISAQMSSSEKMKLVDEGSCAPYYLHSKEVFYRCLPNVLVQAIDKLNISDTDHQKVNGSEISTGMKAIQILLDFQNVAAQIAGELKTIWHWLLAGFIIAMIFSMVYILLARWITYPLVVFSQIGVLGILSYATYYCVTKYKYLNDTKTSKDIVWRLSMGLSDFSRNKNCWLVLGIILVAMLLILLLITIFMMSQIRLACALIAEASRAVCTMLSTLFFPLIPWLLQFVWLAWFIVVLLFLMSNGKKQYQVSHNDTIYNLTVGDVCNPDTFKLNHPTTKADCLFAKYVENVNLLRMQVYHLFGWLWGANFIIAFAECSLAGAFASYYWAFNKPKDIPAMPVFMSMWRALSYHCGSLALGAAIIAIVQMIRISLEYVHKKLKEHTDNPLADFVMRCLKCCFWCLEKCLRFINKNAYIMIAIYGKNFCASAKDAIFLMGRNITSTVAINGVTGFILLLGKLLVTGGIGVASFFWFSSTNPMMPEKLEYSAVPVIICTLAAFLVCKLFFSVYDMGIDTLFLSYLEDIERNDGSPEKPYFMTSSLQSIMNKRNQPVQVSQPAPLDTKE